MAWLDLPFSYDYVGMIDRETGAHHTPIVDWIKVEISEFSGRDLDVAATWSSKRQQHLTYWHHGAHYRSAIDGEEGHDAGPATWRHFIDLAERWQDRDRDGEFCRGGPARAIVERLFSPTTPCALTSQAIHSQVKRTVEWFSDRDQRMVDIEHNRDRLILVDGKPWVRCEEPIIELRGWRDAASLQVKVPQLNERCWKEDYFRLDRLQDAIHHCRTHHSGLQLNLDLDIEIVIPSAFTIEDDIDALYQAADALVDAAHYYLRLMKPEAGLAWFHLKDAIGRHHNVLKEPAAVAAHIETLANELRRLPIKKPYAVVTAKKALDRWSLRPV